MLPIPKCPGIPKTRHILPGHHHPSFTPVLCFSISSTTRSNWPVIPSYFWIMWHMCPNKSLKVDQMAFSNAQKHALELCPPNWASWCCLLPSCSCSCKSTRAGVQGATRFHLKYHWWDPYHWLGNTALVWWKKWEWKLLKAAQFLFQYQMNMREPNFCLSSSKDDKPDYIKTSFEKVSSYLVGVLVKTFSENNPVH